MLAGIVVLALGTSIAVKLAQGDRHRAAATTPPPTLPDGTRSVLPEHRIVAHYGAPQDKNLGILGIGTPRAAVARLKASAAQYAPLSRRPILPAMELITDVAAASPGSDGMYRMRQGASVIRTYLHAARSMKALFIMDLQTGRADFVTEAKALETYLKGPDVGLALDPEWRMGPGQIPGKVIGHVEAAEINRVAKWMSDLVRAGNLPDKVLILHQFTDGMIGHRAGLHTYPGVDIVLNADGVGNPDLKRSTYRRVTRGRAGFSVGFKLFYVEDTDLMTPRQVMALRPQPNVVMYE
ncbi:MAG: hypothetical protein U0Y82_02320 [Thermoleophilia bacterium]